MAILVVASVLTALSAALALRIEVKTGIADTMSKDEPVVARLAYLSENFPGAVTVQVVLEGQDEGRLVEVAKELERGFRESDLVRDVYLEQPVDFFTERALLYLPVEDLSVYLEMLARNEESLKQLFQDPTTLGLLRAAEEIGQRSFPASESMLTLKARVFGRVLFDDVMQGRPAARVGVRVDPSSLTNDVSARATQLLENVPLPPSDEGAKKMLTAAVSFFDLMADVLEEGQSLTPAAFRSRAEKVSEIDLENGAALPSRYRINDDKTMLLLEVAAVNDLTLLENIHPVLAHLESVRDRVHKGSRDVRIGMTGMPVMYDEEQSAILDNFALVTVLGLLGILAVFIIGFERVALPSLATIPLLMGILWTLGVQGAVDPQLNMLNLLFPVLLFGLGIDFAIHIIAGYAERRALGEEPEKALVTTYEAVVPGLVIGAVTTSVAFLVLLIASLKGLRALGFTAGVGVLMALLAMLFVLPALLVLYDRRRQGKGELVPHVHFFVLERLGVFLQRHRYPTLAVFLAATVALAYFVPRVSLERDPMKLQPVGMPASLLQERVLSAFHMNGEPSIWFAKDLVEARRIYDAASRARTLADPISVTMALPTQQEAKAPLISRMEERLEGIRPKEPAEERVWDDAALAELKHRLARIKAAVLELSALTAMLYDDETQVLAGRLRDEINRIDRRLLTASADRLKYLDGLIAAEVTRSLTTFRAMTANRTVTVESLPSSLRDRLQGKDGSWMVLARANEYVFEPEFLAAHLDELNAISPEVTGLTPTGARMLEQILHDVPLLALITILAVAFVVLLSLRSVRGTLLALVPLVVGMVWTLGLLGLFGVPFNFVSILAIPLIIGIGIDDGVHLYHRIKHERAIAPALAHSGKAIILTSLTTGIGFGSLLLSVHRGVFYLGLTTGIGIFVCLALSLFLLPALVAIFDEELLTPEEGSPR